MSLVVLFWLPAWYKATIDRNEIVLAKYLEANVTNLKETILVGEFAQGMRETRVELAT